MNIADYIIEFLSNGNPVTLDGIGTLSTKRENAHYDVTSATFFPSRNIYTLDPNAPQTSTIIAFIAERECVSNNVATQMWANYVAALKDKLKQQSSHSFPTIGTIRLVDNKIVFEAENTSDNELLEQPHRPIKGVKTYPANFSSHPFDSYEQEFVDPYAPKAPETNEPDNVDVPSTEHSQADNEDISQETTDSNTTDEQPSEDSTRSEEANEEPISNSHSAATDQADIASGSPIDHQAEESDEQDGDHANETEMHVDETAATNDDNQEEESQNEQPTVTAQTDSANQTANDTDGQPTSQDNNDSSNEDLLAPLREMEHIGDTPEKTAKPKKRKWWIWLLLLLILLIAGAAAYYFFFYKQSTANQDNNGQSQLEIEDMVSDSEGSEAPSASSDEDNEGMQESSSETVPNDVTAGEDHTSSEAEVSPTNSQPQAEHQLLTARRNATTNLFTYSTDGLTFTQEELHAQSLLIVDYLKGYLRDYLKSQHYSKAYEPMLLKMEEYADERLHPLLDNLGFNVTSLITYRDYVREYSMDAIKARKLTQQRVAVQTELMDLSRLRIMLDDVVSNHPITQDAVQAQEPAPKKQQTIGVPIRTSSKKGFDIIAGSYTNRETAARMAATLRKKGCDAHIINLNQLYFVSMGSASSRTQAEAMKAHIQEWYKGDVEIRELGR